MRILPILFNTEMVRAILEGRKTVARRKINTDIINNCDKEKDGTLLDCQNADGDFIETIKLCRYQPEDILYVRETWQHLFEIDGNEQIVENTGKYYYAATDILPSCGYVDSSGTTHETVPWRPSIHMPKAAARIWLKVTDVRIERLQDIDDNGILAEGLEIGCYFEDIWDSTIKKSDLAKYGWDANPWVWVIEFVRCEKSESEVVK